MSTTQQRTTAQRAAASFGASTTTTSPPQKQKPTTAAALDAQLAELAKQLNLPVARRDVYDIDARSPPTTSLNASFTDIRDYTPGIHSFSFHPITDDMTPDEVDAVHGGRTNAQTEKTLAQEFLRRDDANVANYVD